MGYGSSAVGAMSSDFVDPFVWSLVVLVGVLWVGSDVSSALFGLDS